MSNDYYLGEFLNRVQDRLVTAGIDAGDIGIYVDEAKIMFDYADPISLSVVFSQVSDTQWSLVYDVHQEGYTEIHTFDSLSAAIEQCVNLYQIQAQIRRA